MAAVWAPVVGHLLLLALLPSTSSHMVFDLGGNVYPTGEFHATMHIGDPAKPYFLHVDTGSNLTSLECKVGSKVPHPVYRPTRDKPVPRNNPLCNALHQDVGEPEKPHKTVCNYEIHYLDGSWSHGVLIHDKFTLPSGITKPDIAFGCGFEHGGSHETTTGVDGMLGLGRGSVDLVSQLKRNKIITKNVFAHCLSSKGGGYLSIGDENVLSSPVSWVPMAPRTDRNHNHYSPGPATLHLDTKSISTKTMEVIFDSGSTYTHLPEGPHAQLVAALKASLSKSLKEVRDPSLLHPCWKGPGGFKSSDDLKKEFKSVMSLKFHNGATMIIPPEKYLIVTGHGNACFGMLGRKDIGDMCIIGDITMQDQLVIYDNEHGRLGWRASQCDKKPKSKSDIFSRM
ncbi:aspartic proteinase Asp1-like [Panicum virgatum]|uniref:Peptidase A1 domain-containing protein n=1 Tax=Panicum virgatum TaxID=38727 RepID=A0A8T0PRL1_PANVG|nr:aspartic proteinase Asp1-like [Panicum virgatum]KAG2560744.1 hypothetical protein PVAP13_8KG083100 [Panicum virgatum]